MKTSRAFCVLLLALTLLSGCFGKFPVEVVELNVTVGKDIQALHRSYRALIDTHFNTLRAQVEEFIKNRWKPEFIKDFTRRGNLEQLVKSGRQDRVNQWTTVAMETVEKKREQLLAPIDAREKELLQMVDRSFMLLGRANNEVTAHLKSRRKAAAAMEVVRELYDLKGLREKIENGLTEAADLTRRQTTADKAKTPPPGESK